MKVAGLGVTFPGMATNPGVEPKPGPALGMAPSGLEPGIASVVAAFGAVYVIWGSTYLGILWAIETIPPLLMASVRFLAAGAILFAWSIGRRAELPDLGQWRAAAIAGGLMLGGGNGSVVIAEQWVPSGMAALLVASVPLWLVLFDALFGSGETPSRRARVGLLGGFAGVALLGGSPGLGSGGPQEIFGMVLILAGCAAWAGGSLYVRRMSTRTPPLLWVSMQMIAGGAILGFVGLAAGEWGDVRISQVSVRSGLALAYLIVFGALIAYSAYVWLLRVSTPARVGTYAYVNPVIALLLGWWLAGETMSVRSLVAAVTIVGSVVVIVSEARPPASRPSAAGGRTAR